jgi:hypothetical protein
LGCKKTGVKEMVFLDSDGKKITIEEWELDL